MKEGLVRKKTVKGGKDKGWKERYLLLTLDSLEYYDKKKKKCLGSVEICGATVEAVPAAKDKGRIIGVRMTHPSWKENDADVELYIEYNDEDQFSAWKKELDRAVARKSVPGGRGPSHLGWKKHSGKQAWSSRDSSTGGGSKDSDQGKGRQRKKGGGDDDDF